MAEFKNVLQESKERWSKIDALVGELKDSLEGAHTAEKLMAEIIFLLVEQMRPLYANTQQEVDELANGLQDIMKMFNKAGQ
jgi:hypothetical protein